MQRTDPPASSMVGTDSSISSRTMAEKVAAAMGDKYWSDVFVRFFSHPLTLRLAPE